MDANLIEPGVKYWLNQTLKEYRKFKENNLNFIFNIGMTCLLIVTISGFLLYKYKGGISQDELEQKKREKEEYIVSKLQKLALVKNSNLITNLPTWGN
jgi:nitrogen regulatory protein PII-like uncharacterized protein